MRTAPRQRNRRKRCARQAAALLLLLTLVACGRRPVFSCFQPVGISAWDRTDTLFFTIPPVGHDATLDEQIGLRIASTYPFMSLTMVVEQWTSPPSFHHKDTMLCRLIDEDGTIQGQGIGRFQYDFPLRRIHIGRNDTLFFTIRHNMKREEMPGISDVGITLAEQ